MAATTAIVTGDEFEEESISKCESLRLKTLAEQSYTSSDLKSSLKYAKRAHRLCPTLDGISNLLTAVKILNSAAANPHWYKILEVEPFSHINLIKKQYKKLALILHPDKNTFVASEAAFKLVNEAFSVLSDKIRRKEYDMKLRIEMQNAAEIETESGSGAVVLDTFWTACSICRLLHQFERKYLGHNLMCPNCKKSFKAVEVDDSKKMDISDDDDDDNDDDEEDDRILIRKNSKRKMSSVGDIMKRTEGMKKIDRPGNEDVSKRSKVRNSERLKEKRKIVNDVVDVDDDDDDEEMMTLAEMRKLVKTDDNDGDEEEETMTLAEMQKLVKTNVNEIDDDDDEEEDEIMTLAEMQKLVKTNVNGIDDDDDDEDEDEDEEEEEEIMTLAEMQKLVETDVNENDDEEEEEEMMTLAEMQKVVKTNMSDGKLKVKLKVNVKDRVERKRSTRGNSKNETNGEAKNHNLDIITVEDSDFYDFDKGRVEKSFKKGQIWALYDDNDGMPRHYGLIEEVVSTHPFEVNMAWLDPQSNGDDVLINLEKTGFHISCGRFKVSKKTSVTSLNVFSHIVDCERAAREVYRIYPKKGSVWALYSEDNVNRENRHFDIVLFLTSYSEVHGLSMAYLEKVDGYKTIFRRREIGCHAIKWLEKHEVQLFSHQIPARIVSEEEVTDISENCWELDPASLPTDLLTIDYQI